MSDSIPPSEPAKDPVDKSASDTTPASSAAPKDSRARTWRKRLVRVIVFAVMLSFVTRVLVPVVFPPVLRKVARSYGLDATYDRLELYLMGGDVGLWGLRFTPIGGGRPVLETAYCRASISTLGLLRGHLNVDRVEAEGADVLIERTKDGRLPLIEQIIGSASVPAPASSKKSKLSLDSPLTINVARLQDATVRFLDSGISPPADNSMKLDALISDVGSADKRAKFAVTIHSPQALAALYVTGSAMSRNNVVDMDLSLRMYGLNLIPAKAYLAPLGLLPTSGELTAQADGKLQARVTGGATTTQPSASENLSATIEFTGVTLASESRQAAKINRVLIDASSLGPDAIRIRQILLDGVGGAASRTPEGHVRFAGIEWAGMPPSPMPATQDARAATTAPASPHRGPVIDLKQLLVQNVDFSFTDSTMQPPVSLGLQVPRLAIENLCTDPAQSTAPATISLAASAPGIAKSISVEGTATPDGHASALQMTVTVDGITLAGIDPYLEGLRLKRTLKDARFTCAVTGRLEPKPDGSLAASLKASDATLIDGSQQLLSMPLIELDNANVDADGSHISVDAVSLIGPVLPAHQLASGAFEALGLQYDAAAKVSPRSLPAIALPASAPTTEAVPATGPAPLDRRLSLPSVAVGKFTWRGAGVRLVSDASREPINVSIEQVQVDGENLIFDASGKTNVPGSVKLAFKMPGVMEDLAIAGKLTPGPSSLAFDLSGQSGGISARQLKPLLNAVGIEPVLDAGALTFTARGKLTQEVDRLSADVNIAGVHFADGGTQWLAMDNLAIAGASFDGKTFAIDSLQLDAPSAQVTRDDKGAITVAGMKLLPRGPATPAIVTAATTQAAPVPTRLDLSLPIVAKIKSFAVRDASIRLLDADVLPATDLSAKLSVTASNLLAGADGEPSTFSLTMASPGAIDSLKVDGEAKLAPAHQEIHLVALGTGVSGKSLEPYLPANISTRMNGGQFKATLWASLDPNPQGGSRGQVTVMDVGLRDGLSDGQIAGLAALRVAVDRFDLAGRRIDISKLALEHASLAVRKDAAGLSLLGVTIAPKPVRAEKPAAAKAEPVAAAGASNVAALVAAANEKAPLITIGALSIEADRISFSAPALAQPIALTKLSLTSSKMIELLGDQPTQNPPFDLHGRGAVEGLVNSMAIDARVAPFAAEPSAKVDVAVTGIHGDQLTAFVPQLKEKVDGADLTDGQFKASAEAQFNYTRRGVFGIDLTRDVTSTFEVKHLELTQSDKLVAGLDGIRGEGVRYSPASGSVVVKSLEISKPAASIVRDAQGIHVLGLTLHVEPSTQPAAATAPAETHDAVAITPATTQPTTVPVVAAAATQPSTTPAVAVASTQPSDAPAAEYRIDALTVSGADFVIEDRVGSPFTVLPIKDLDLDVKGLSSRALAEPNRPIRFSLLVGAGKVPLPPRKAKAGVETEDREIFSEASATGNFTLVPKPQGFMKASLSGLELNSIRGLASQLGVGLSGATFDVRAEVRMRGTDAFDARIYPTFNELRLSEAPNGPLQRGLKLPTPPDFVIKTLEDADGSISFPIRVPIEAGKLQWGPIMGSAVESLSGVLVGAMAAAPLKVASAPLGMIGLDLSSGRSKPIAPIVIDFAPGESQLTADQLSQIQRAIAIMKHDKSMVCTIQQSLGSADLRLVEQRANPLSRDIWSIVAGLRQRKLELQQELAVQNGQVDAVMASQNSDATKSAVDSARATSTRLKETEDALDQALELMRPGADRQTLRRTKTLAVLLGGLRLGALEAALDQSDLPSAADRVRKTAAPFNADPTDAAGHATLTLVRRAKG